MAPSAAKRVSETPAPEPPPDKRSRRGAKAAETPATPPVKKEKGARKASASTSPARGRQASSFEAINPDVGRAEVVLYHPDAIKLFTEVQVALYVFPAC
jgi:hypothetical protein